MIKPLTSRQQNILNFIKDYLEINSYPPTFREIGKHFDISSTFGVKRHIDALTKKGYLNSESNARRTLSVTDLGSNSNTARKNSSFEIPIIGRVAAGYPIFSEENMDGTLMIDGSLINKKSSCFALRVKGDSMINAGIFDNDLVIISSQNSAENNDIVVALLDNESTLKRFKVIKNKMFLYPENENYKPIAINGESDFLIVGKAIGIFRVFS